MCVKTQPRAVASRSKAFGEKLTESSQGYFRSSKAPSPQDFYDLTRPNHGSPLPLATAKLFLVSKTTKNALMSDEGRIFRKWP